MNPVDRKPIGSEEAVSLILSDNERKLILKETFVDMGDPHILRVLRSAKTDAVSFNLDDWTELQEYVAAAANHAKKKVVEKALQSVWQKIQSQVLDAYIDQD